VFAELDFSTRSCCERRRSNANVFRDEGHKDADVVRLKAVLAAEIIKALDRERLTFRAAHSRTGIAAADFSRIPYADLGRLTDGRLMGILDRLGCGIDFQCVASLDRRKSHAVGRVARQRANRNASRVQREGIQGHHRQSLTRS
jgi:hypothetical protein